MAPVKVVVSGNGTIHQQPERGTVSIRIQSTGENQADISADVRTTVQDVQAKVRPLAAPTPFVTHWSSSSMSMRSYYENQNGLTVGGFGSTIPAGRETAAKRKIYEAAVTIDATFRDFDKLSDFTTSLSVHPLATVGDVDWTLSEETQRHVQAEAIRRSYHDALAKARAYSEAMGKNKITPVEVNQSGSNSRGLFGGFGGKAFAAAPSGDQGLLYLPQDVSYSVDCDVTFELE